MARGHWQGLAAQNISGDLQVLASPSVTVIDAETGGNATISSDRAGTSPLSQPFTGGADGTIDFYTTSARVNVTATSGGNSVTWNDQPTGLAAEKNTGTASGEVPTNAEVGAYSVSVTDGGTDAFSGDFGRDIASGEVVTADFGSANTTTTPTLENTGGTPTGAKTIKTRDGSALWAGAISGVHRLEWDGTDFLLLDPFTLDNHYTKAEADASFYSLSNLPFYAGYATEPGSYNLAGDGNLYEVPFSSKNDLVGSWSLDGNGRLVVPDKGVAIFHAQIEFLSGTAGLYKAQLCKNGSSVSQRAFEYSTAQYSTISISDMVICAAGDGLSVDAAQNTGSSVAIDVRAFVLLMRTP